ncbi:MAG: glycosyltransferase family 39 protein [Bacteroidota bacterium]|nr:glycosyltransferase family 39 protein [Bacteroidota bacterium]
MPPGRFQIIGLLLLAVLLYFSFFNHLDRLPLSMWDEARVATNAIEMWNGHNPLVPYFEDKPDMFSLKPPLLPWLQALSLKLFGYNKLAIRFPSAIAAFITCLLFFYFTGHLKEIKGNLLIPAFSSVVLASTVGYVKDHAARTGDYDTLLTLSITGYILLYYLWVEQPRPRYLYLTAMFVALAVLTKGIAGLLGIPALLIITLIEKKLLVLIRQRAFIIACLMALIPILTYYLAREISTPGYIGLVLEGELIAIPTQAVQGHGGSFLFYLEEMYYSEFSAYIYVLLAALIYYLVVKNPERRLIGYVSIYIFSYLLIISMMTSKMEWYNLPVYPAAALVCGFFIYRIGEGLAIAAGVSGLKHYGFILLAGGIFITGPYIERVTYHVHAPPAEWGLMQYGSYTEGMLNKMPSIDSFTFADHEYNSHLAFYHQVYKQQKGLSVDRKNLFDKYYPDEVLVSCSRFTQDSLSAMYQMEVIDVSAPCKTMRVIGKADTISSGN